MGVRRFARKREAGVSPARLRRCNGGRVFHAVWQPLSHQGTGRRKTRMNPKSEDLPVMLIGLYIKYKTSATTDAMREYESTTKNSDISNYLFPANGIRRLSIFPH